MKIIQETKIYRQNGKKWTLPTVLNFGGSYKRDFRKYEVLGYRPPKSGEFYLSGAICEAHEAFNDLSSPYLIAKPIGEPLTQKMAWVKKIDYIKK